MQCECIHKVSRTNRISLYYRSQPHLSRNEFTRTRRIVSDKEAIRINVKIKSIFKNDTTFVVSFSSNYAKRHDELFFRTLWAFHTSRIGDLSPFLLFAIKLDNTLSSVVLRRRNRRGSNGAILRGCNTCSLTQSAVSQGHSVCSAGAHTYVLWEMCGFTWMWRTGTQLYSTSTRLVYMCYRGDSLLPAAQQWAIASSEARRRCGRPGESRVDERCQGAVAATATSCFQTNQASSRGDAALSFATADAWCLLLFGRWSDIHHQLCARVLHIQLSLSLYLSLFIPFFFALAERTR